MWDREGYNKEPDKQLSYMEACQELNGYGESTLIKIIKTIRKNICNRRDISDKSLMNLVPNIHKGLHDVPDDQSYQTQITSQK